MKIKSRYVVKTGTTSLCLLNKPTYRQHFRGRRRFNCGRVRGDDRPLRRHFLAQDRAGLFHHLTQLRRDDSVGSGGLCSVLVAGGCLLSVRRRSAVNVGKVGRLRILLIVIVSWDSSSSSSSLSDESSSSSPGLLLAPRGQRGSCAGSASSRRRTSR